MIAVQILCMHLSFVKGNNLFKGLNDKDLSLMLAEVQKLSISDEAPHSTSVLERLDQF